MWRFDGKSMEIYQKAFYKNLDTRERALYHTIKHMNKCSYVCDKMNIQIKSKRSLGKKMERKEEKIIQDIECCEVEEVHEDKVRMISDQMPPEDQLYDLAELFKAFGDTTRIRILFALFEADICVCDLAASLNMTQSAVSHQLRLLKQARLVAGRREGKQIIYYLADDHVRTIIQKGMEHIQE